MIPRVIHDHAVNLMHSYETKPKLNVRRLMIERRWYGRTLAIFRPPRVDDECLGFISTAGNEIVPAIIRQFRELNAEVEFSLRNVLTIDQIQMLEAGSLDIGFLRLPIGEHSGLEVVTVHRESFVLVVPSSHKLAKRKRVRLREASGQDFVMYERTYAPGFHDLIFGMLRDAGIIPKVRQTAGEMPMLISLVDSGVGVAILPASAVKRSVASVVACEIADQIPMSEIGIAVQKGSRAPVLDNFRSLALEKLRRAGSASFANLR